MLGYFFFVHQSALCSSTQQDARAAGTDETAPKSEKKQRSTDKTKNKNRLSNFEAHTKVWKQN